MPGTIRLNFNNNQCNMICDAAAPYIEEIFGELAVEYKTSRKLFIGPCPVHGGDNPTAWNYYPDGETVKGYWRCNTQHCEKKYKPTLIGFVRGVLSYNANRDVGVTAAIEFICKVAKLNPNNIKIDFNKIDQNNFIKDANRLSLKQQPVSCKIPRDIACASLKIPAQLYLDRGFSAKILTKYDVGLCDNPEREMFNRVVFPVYDDDYEFVIGCSGRSVWNQCSICNLYHNQDDFCPETNLDKLRCAKWRHNKGFCADSYLYNYWFAKKHILQTRRVILVEGPGDVLKLVQSGINNVVGCFGARLTDAQQIILERSGAMEVDLLFDNDDAGKDATERVYDSLKRYYKINILQTEAKDIGEAEQHEIDRISR